MPDINVHLYFAEQTDPLELSVRTSENLTLQRVVAYSGDLHLGQINLVAPRVQSGHVTMERAEAGFRSSSADKLKIISYMEGDSGCLSLEDRAHLYRIAEVLSKASVQNGQSNVDSPQWMCPEDGPCPTASTPCCKSPERGIDKP